MLTSFDPPPVSTVILNGHFLRILSESCGSQIEVVDCRSLFTEKSIY